MIVAAGTYTARDAEIAGVPLAVDDALHGSVFGVFTWIYGAGGCFFLALPNIQAIIQWDN